MTTTTETPALDACKGFIRDGLAHGPRYIKQEAIDAGHSEASVRRALKELAEAAEIVGQGSHGRPTLYSLNSSAEGPTSDQPSTEDEQAAVQAAVQQGLQAAVWSVQGALAPHDLPADLSVVIGADGAIYLTTKLTKAEVRAKVVESVGNVSGRPVRF